MNDKMEKVVQELRKRFKGSIEFYDDSVIQIYEIEYCINDLHSTIFLPYYFISEKDTREIVLSLNKLIVTDIHNHFL